MHSTTFQLMRCILAVMTLRRVIVIFGNSRRVGSADGKRPNAVLDLVDVAVSD
jgi:hypothetical protein